MNQQIPADLSPLDQRRLDDLLWLLCRRETRLLREQDFAASWPDTLTAPFEVLLHERDDVEHRFVDSELERHRTTLLRAAYEFLGREAMHGFVSNGSPRRRIAGYSPGEVEGFPEREKALRGHQAAIAPSAVALLEAHDALVLVAQQRGYDISALHRERHPRVQAIHDDFDSLDTERWWGDESGGVDSLPKRL